MRRAQAFTLVSLAFCIGLAPAGFAAGRNLIANPGFEDGLIGWSTGHGWYESPKGSGISAVTLDSTTAHSGKCCLRINGKGNRGITMQVFPVRPGHYHLSAWIKTRGLGAATASVLAEWMSKGEGKWLAGSPIAAVSGDSDWRLVEGDVEAPADARSVHVDLLTNVANSGTAWFDDVSLTRVPTASAPPAAVRFTVAAPNGGSGELKLDWSAHRPEDDVIAYRIYCSDKPFTSSRGLQPAAVVDADARSASVSGLRNGQQYHVAVVAVNMEGMALQAVASTAGTARDLKPPQSPRVTVRPLMAGSRFGQSALLSWTVSPEDDDIAEFDIEVSSDRNGRLLRLPPDARSTLLKNLPQRNALLYVVAKDQSGNTSQPAEVMVAASSPGTGKAALSGVVTVGRTPAAGAAVEVRRGGRVIARTTTSYLGRYVFAELPDGMFLVQATRAGLPVSRPIYILTGGGAITADIELPPAKPWTAWVVDPVANVFRDAPAPASPSLSVHVTALANQKRSAQIVIRPTQDLTISGVRFESLLSADGARAIPAENLSYNFVSYVHLKANSTAMPPDELVRKAPDDFPDELSGDASRDVKASNAQPIFITIGVPKSTKAGVYTGRAFVETPLGEQPFAIRVNVIPLRFPDKTRLFVVNWLDWNALARRHGVTPWTDGFYHAIRIYTRLMREHHQNVIVIPPDLCRIYVEPDKSVTFDWSQFDRAAMFFIDEGVGERLCIGHLGGRTTGEWECPTFSLSPRPATFRESGQPTSVTPEEFAAALQDHLEKKGWLARTMQHIGDEPIPVNVASYREQSARIHKAAPKLRRIDAIHVPDLKGALEVWVPELEYFDRWYEGYRRFQRAGDAELWFYIAWVPQGKYPQRLIDTHAIKARTIHWMNYLWDTAGYLHWALEWWDIDVESLAPGDSRIIWPGKEGPNSSLRYEAQREGLEDCEMLSMLEDAGRDAAAKLGVTGYDPKSRPKELGHSVIRTITDYSRSYSELEAVRAQVGAEIVGLRKGPVLLTRVSKTADKPVKAGDITVEGWSEAGAAVTVNGKAVKAADGRFRLSVSVSVPSPDIVVRASKGGRTSEVVRRYKLDG
jgi:hypothetical protein